MPATLLCLNNILNYNFGAIAYAQTLPATMYFGLSTHLLTATDVATTDAVEPTVGSYARKSFTNNDTNWSTSTLGTSHNDVALTFIESTASWGTALSIFITDTASGAGNIWWYYTLNPEIIIQDNTIVNFPIGSIIVSMT